MHGGKRMGHTRWRAAVAALVAGLAAGCASTSATATLRVSGSTTVGPIVADAAEVLRARGVEVTVDTQGGSAGGIAQLGAGQIDVGLSSKPITPADRDAHPGTELVATLVGRDAVGVVVDRAVHDGGVTALDVAELRRLFAGEVDNWAELGGPDLPVFVYQKEPGRGTYEVLMNHLYPGGDVPPPPDTDRYAIVGGNEETRTKLASTPGAVGPLSVAFATETDALAAIAVDGVAPTAANISDGSYPLSRPLLLLTDGRPAGAAADLVAFVLSDEGQAIVAANGYLTLEQLDGS